MTSQFPTAAPAATIILIRPAETGFEVYLLKRSTESKFMAGNYVFPGGMVDEADGDFDQWSAYVDMDPSTLERRLGGGLELREALAYAVAAIRETFEEAGVLLARPEAANGDGMERARRQRDADSFKKGWFHTVVTEHHLRLDLSGLYRWAHWITPREMKRHFDTRFFVAVMPPDQTCRPDARETIMGTWMRPLEALEANMRGEISLSPPTIVTLQALSKFNRFETLQEEIEKRPWGQPIRPRYIIMAKDSVVVEPWDPEFQDAVIDIDPDTLADKLLPAVADFSRIWLHAGLWRPVGI